MSTARARWTVLVIVVVLAAALAACSDEDTVSPVQPVVTADYDVDAMPLDNKLKTPFQRATKETLDERRLNGLPAPIVTFTYETSTGEPVGLDQLPMVNPGAEIVITATTAMSFAGPEDAGLAEWPPMEVEGSLPEGATGVINAGNYDAQVQARIAQADPTFWNRYTYGHEPRTYEVTETYTVTYPDAAPAPESMTSGTETTDSDEVVLGFSIEGPHVNYSQGWGWSIWGIQVIDFSAGIYFDYGFGVRLPMQSDVTNAEPMLEGSTYYPAGSVKGLNYSVADFVAAGVPPEDGNEFVLYFRFGFHFYFRVGTWTLINAQWGHNFDESRSFQTPFGPNQSFSLPMLTVPIYGFNAGVFGTGVDLAITPRTGSDKLTASWLAAGNAAGGGAIQYHNPGAPVTLGALKALDGPGTANVQITDYRYYFNHFVIDLGLSLWLQLLGLYNARYTIPIVSFDLGDILGFLYVGPHAGSWPGTTADFAIQNVPPSVVIDRSGAVMAGGLPTLIGRGGTPVGVRAEATDPGQDDITMVWDFGDGGAGVTKHYPVPHQVVDTGYHSLQAPHVYTATLTAMDDDGAMDHDRVSVLVVGVPPMSGEITGRQGARPLTYWQRQFSGTSPADFAPSTLQDVLDVVSYMSEVFDSYCDASTIDEASQVVCNKSTTGSTVRHTFDRELLGVWLNFAIGLCPYDEWVDTNGDRVADTPFLDAIRAVEAIRMNPATTDFELLVQMKLLQRINGGVRPQGGTGYTVSG